jgi:hypothetical protein
MMKLTIRQKLGVGLIAFAGLGTVVALMWTAPPFVEVHDGGNIAIGPVHLSQSTVVTTYHLPFFYPLLICGLAGFLCLLWPPRNVRNKEPQ